MSHPLQTFLFLITIVAAFLIGIVVFLKNPRAVINQSFTIFLLGIAGTICGFLFLLSGFPFLVFDRTIHYGGLTLLLGLFLFAQVFPDRTVLPKGRLGLFLPFPIVALFVIPFGLLIRQAPVSSEGVAAPVNGPLLLPYGIFWGTYFVLSIIFLVRTYRNSTGKERLQMQYLFTGIGFFLSCLFIFDLVLPILGVSGLYIIGPLSSIILILLAGYAIVRHQLLDIRIVVQRSLIYTVLFALLVAVYIASLALVGFVLGDLANIGVLISAGLTAVLGAFFIRPLESFFQKITDSIFFKKKYNYAEALHSLSLIMYTSLNQDEIVQRSQEILKNIFKTDTANIIVDPESVPPLPESDQSPGYFTLSSPIVFQDTPVGMLRLGPKRSGESYTKQDLQLISTFSFQAAISITKARLHDKVREYNLHLEQLVEERTKELRKLQESQREIMIDISHNLQTPLAIIRGELEIFEETVEPEKTLIIRKSLDRVSGFIRQLLHLSRLDNSLYVADMSPIDLSNLLSEESDYFEVMAAEKFVVFRSEIEPGVHVSGNKKLIEEMLTNLVVNAITYRRDLPAGESSVSLTLSKDSGSAIIKVKDNGVGISKDDLQNIFARFYSRADKTKSGPFGSGLGLAIARRIATTHKGEIHAESKLGRGTTFTVTLPLL